MYVCRHCRPLESWLFFLLVWFNMGMGTVAHLMYTYTKEKKMEWYQIVAVMTSRLVPLAIESQYLLSCLLLQRAYRSITICFRNTSRGFFPSDQVRGAWPPRPPARSQSPGVAARRSKTGPPSSMTHCLSALQPESLVDGPLGEPLGGPLGVALADTDRQPDDPVAPVMVIPWASKVTWGPGQGPGQGLGAQKTGPQAAQAAPASSRAALLSRLRVLHQRVYQQVRATLLARRSTACPLRSK